jgi:hypothetical protein
MGHLPGSLCASHRLLGHRSATGILNDDGFKGASGVRQRIAINAHAHGGFLQLGRARLKLYNGKQLVGIEIAENGFDIITRC